MIVTIGRRLRDTGRVRPDVAEFRRRGRDPRRGGRVTAARRALAGPFARFGVAVPVLAVVHHQVSQDLIVGLFVVLSALPVLGTVAGVVRRTPGRARRWWVRPLLASALMVVATLVYARVVA